MRAKRGFGRTHMMTLRAPRAGPVAGAGGEGTPLGGRVCHIKLSPMVCSSAHGKILCGGDTSMADCHCRCAARSVVVGPPHVWIFVPTSKDSTFPRFHVSTFPPFHHSTIPPSSRPVSVPSPKCTYPDMVWRVGTLLGPGGRLDLARARQPCACKILEGSSV